MSTKATLNPEAAAAELMDLFPPGTRLDTDGTLVVGGCRLDDVAEQFGTPAIVVSEDALRGRARDYLAAFRSRWPRCGTRWRRSPRETIAFPEWITSRSG